MKKFLLIAVGLILSLPVLDKSGVPVVNDVAIWYEAFNKRNAALAEAGHERGLGRHSGRPGQPSGRGWRPVHPRLI